MVNNATVILSGGGTAGHIYPAVATAKALKQLLPGCNILFVGASNRMEMQLVPKEGFEIKGLNIAGYQRGSILKNLSLPFKVAGSVLKALRIIKSSKAVVCAGFGGYASAPLLAAARLAGVPYLIQEQNSYAGVTNKILAKAARKICVAYPNMQAFFPAGKLVFTGNPVRQQVIDIAGKRQQASAYFGLQADKKTILVVGGSLGAKTLNACITAAMQQLSAHNVQVLWQTGKNYYNEIMGNGANLPAGIVPLAFIDRMDLAYAAADVVISRAGAATVSELCCVSKPAVLVPSPNVAEDHQTKNALAIKQGGGCLLVSDADAAATLVPDTLQLLNDAGRCATMAAALKAMAVTDADLRIANEIIKLLK